MKDLTCEILQPQDFDAFSEYITEAFHPRYIMRDQRYAQWQFSGIVVLRHNAKIIGHNGYRDIDYMLGQPTTMRVSMNTFVHPTYRAAGLGARMVEVVADTPYPLFGFGFTCAMGTLLPHLRDEWKERGRLTRHLACLKEHSLFNQYGTAPVLTLPLATSRVQEEKVAGPEFDDLWARVGTTLGLTVVRDRAYLTWRYFNHPFFTYTVLSLHDGERLTGYVIYRIEQSENFSIARIIDIIAEDSHSANELIIAVLGRARVAGSNAVDYMHAGGPYGEVFNEAGFFDTVGTPFEKFPILFSPLSTSHTSINVGFDLPNSLEQCYFTKADGDQDRPNPT